MQTSSFSFSSIILWWPPKNIIELIRIITAWHIFANNKNHWLSKFNIYFKIKFHFNLHLLVYEKNRNFQLVRTNCYEIGYEMCHFESTLYSRWTCFFKFHRWICFIYILGIVRVRRAKEKCSQVSWPFSACKSVYIAKFQRRTSIV